MLIQPYGSDGGGGSYPDSVDQIHSIYKESLHKLNIGHPDRCKHFAYNPS
ncbi:MAG: hypothetical protein KR126chlam4_00090 [Candidatus Anoxychlamydiales bacterium]|uniref:Uncharacterized protein n=1 Tax=marine sediment metagenome TaxID=412755 RepID=A0A0F9G767_9ZZZZ|nr:hypothetical protein [Candidatus Anoxychlamydiales bacterium]NGX40273.1 hypothetical protein [Candidatus Anoxychlamydiales bacterium]